MFRQLRKTWAIASVVSIASFSFAAQAAPTITSVDTSQLSQGYITIKGSGFGGAPNVEVYDDFEHNGAKFGAAVDTNQAIVGSWSSNPSASQPTYDNIAHSGNYSFDAWHDATTKPGRLSYVFQNPAQSVYMSYWVQIPAGYPFPGMDSSYQGFFASDSSWKFTWLIDQDATGNSSDLCVPTYTGRGNMMIAGNDLNIAYLPTVDQLWSKGKWMRISAWLDADPNAPTASGRVKMEIWSAEHGFYVYDRQQPVFDADGPSAKQYRYINIPGWIRDFPGNNGRPLYDDIYISTGSNAFARIELTDAKDYQGSTKFAIQKPVSWTDNQVTFQVVKADIADINGASIHLFTGGGQATATGTPVGSGGSTPPTAASPPVAPTLQVSVSK